MPRIFNAIRQRLLKESRLTRYLVYAVGEILLVVIGILIALQVNGWNQARQAREAECTVLHKLLVDLRANATHFEQEQLKMERQRTHTQLLLDIMRSDPAPEALGALDTLLFQGTEVVILQPQLEYLHSVLNNKMELIADDEVQERLTRFPAVHNRYKAAEAILRGITTNRLRPRMQEYIYLRGLNPAHQEFPSDRRALLADRTIANMLTDRYWEMGDWFKGMKALREENELLIASIEAYLSRSCKK
ncbi:MAG: hypothetical protein KIT10_04780 [Flavobacteriales bacterium]|nr:hypothetical protein [Flavobacteriales bacterium]